MRNTNLKLLTGVSAFALAAALASGAAWAQSGTVEVKDNINIELKNEVKVGDSNTGDIGQAVSDLALGQNAVNGFTAGTEVKITSQLADTLEMKDNVLNNQVASQNNLNSAVNSAQQGTVTITVGVGSIGATNSGDFGGSI